MVLVFGDHRLDLERRELRRGGEPVAIEPKAFEAALCLARVRDSGCEPTVAAIMRGPARGLAPDILARMAEGLRKAGVPE